MSIICGPDWDQRVVNLRPRGKVGIIMSGGIDSWVLYNLLTNHTSPRIFNIVREDSFDGPDRVRELTGREVIEMKELTNRHAERIPVGIEFVLENYDVDEVYYGINAVPPNDHFPEFNTFDQPVRPWRIEDPMIKTPFLHLYKYHILDLALKRNIPLTKTMSCIRNTKHACGECWQCREKAWGFAQLGVQPQ